MSSQSNALDLTFPEVNEKFFELSELQREPFVAGIKGNLLSGSGTISEVGKCGFTDNSKKYGSKCLQVTLENEIPRAVLFYSKDKTSELSNLNIGSALNFDKCEIITLKDWGFWTTVYCDMP